MLENDFTLLSTYKYDQSLKTETFLVNIFCLYIGHAASLFALGQFFSLTLDFKSAPGAGWSGKGGTICQKGKILRKTKL